MQKISITTFFVSLFFTMLIGSTVSSTAYAQYTVTVSAGGFDRTESIVSFPFPDAVGPGVYAMQDESGDESLVQVDAHNKGWFILEDLPAGESKTYTLSTDIPASSDDTGVSYTFDSNTISFDKGDKTVLSYYYKENNPPAELDSRYKRAGYIHPLYSPGGTPLTNHLDTEMHPHHYGVWSAWTNTEFQGRTPDFWNVHDNTARVDHKDSLEVAWEGPVFGGLKAKNHFVDISSSAPVIAINEEWQLRVFNNSAESEYHVVDLVMTHTANSGQPLTLPEYHYGGTAFRGHQNWDNPENISFLTSEGHDRSNANETRARWAIMEGEVADGYAGMAMLGHPDNFRAPQPVRIHDNTPYFVYAPMQFGEFSIEPGSPYVMCYRFITYDGEGDAEQIDRLWNDYAYPPEVTVEAQ